MTLEEAKEILKGMQRRAITDDLNSTIRTTKEDDAIETVLNVIDSQVKIYKKWAEDEEAHVCTTCIYASHNRKRGTKCPIEKHFALPWNGHCHLWTGRMEKYEW